MAVNLATNSVLRVIDGCVAMSRRLSMASLRIQDRLRYLRFRVAYQPHPTDIFIATYPKSGTTLVHMILYQLLTDGDMGIPHLNRFAPYLEDLIKGEARVGDPRCRKEGSAPRRIAKTHLPYNVVPKGCGRYIYVVRDGRDAAVSYYHHHRRNGYDKSFPDYFHEFVKGVDRFGSWFEHVDDWTRNRDRLNVLYLRFEDLLADLDGAVRRIADFCEIPLREEEMPRILRNCSFDFMRRHESKLDVRTRKCGDLDPENDHFVRQGKTGGWVNYLDPQLSALYDARFERHFGNAPAAMDKYFGAHEMGN